MLDLWRRAGFMFAYPCVWRTEVPEEELALPNCMAVGIAITACLVVEEGRSMYFPKEL